MSKKIWIDCNGRADECAAILTALSLQKLQVIGLSAVSALEFQKETKSLLRNMISFAGYRDIPCVIGSSEPIASSAAGFQPPFNIQTIQISEDNDDFRKDVTDEIWKAAQENDGLTLVTLGPLTNVARLLLAHPDVTKHIKEIVVAGGMYQRGFSPAHSEYNIWSDPYAAKLVLNNDSLLVSMMTLEAAQSANKVYHRLQVPTVIKELLRTDCTGQENAVLLRGISIIMYLLAPDTFECIKCHVDVELKSRYSMGQVVCDLAKNSHKDTDVLVAVQAHLPQYEKTMNKAFADISENFKKHSYRT